MKTNLNVLSAILASALVFAAQRASGDLEVSTSVRIHAVAEFQAPLAAHGAWVEVGRFGHCWRPAGIAVEWRPYCSGSWVWTDCGWYWASDEPWAWACYHYGWWTLDPTFGWIWVPGVEWAPAWVSWRVGGGYCGWAPLPPHGVILAPATFVFVEERRFHEPVRPSAVVVNNTKVFNDTQVINNVKHETRTIANAGPQRVVVNEGPRVEAIQKATGQKLAQVSVSDAIRQTPEPQTIRRNPAPQGKPDRNNAPPPAGVPDGKVAPPVPPVPPATDQPAPRDAVDPAVPRTPGPPARPPGPPRGKGEEKSHDKK
jgi:hypothetical protein